MRFYPRASETRQIKPKSRSKFPPQRLRYWDTEKKQYVVEPGDYEFLIGAASDDIRLKLPMTITAQ